METTVFPSSSKKKKRKSECVEEPSAAFDVNTPVERKKKRKTREGINLPLPPANEQIILKEKQKKQQNGSKGYPPKESSETKKQKMNYQNAISEESVSIATVSGTVVTMDTNQTKKKKNKKKQHVGVEDVAVETSEKNTENMVDESFVLAVSDSEEPSVVTPETNHTKKKKKKKQQVGQAYVAIETSEKNIENMVDESCVLAVSDSQEPSVVTPETNHTKKKKKKKQQVGQAYVAVETSEKNTENMVDESFVLAVSDSEEPSVVTPETNHTKKKKKKKQQVGQAYVAIETSEKNIENMVDESCVLAVSDSQEPSVVSMETNHTKKKKQQIGQEYVAIETSEKNIENMVDENFSLAVSDSEDASVVSMETNHTKKKKKKKQQVGEEYVAIETSVNKIKNGKNDESVVIRVGDSQETSGVSLETNHTTEKRKQQGGDEEDLVAIDTTVNNHKNEMKDESADMMVDHMEENPLVTMKVSPTKFVVDVMSLVGNQNKQKVSITMATTDLNNKDKQGSVSVETPIKSSGKKTGGTMSTSKKKQGANNKINEKKPQMTPKSKAIKEGINVHMDELEEFIPNARKMSADRVFKFLRYDLHRLRKFKEQGVTPRRGQCSELENQQIRENIEDFLTLTGISSAAELMFPERFPDKTSEIKKLKVQHKFMERIAEGIPRTCEAVYSRAKKMFDDGNHLGRFTEEELLSLKMLHSQYGNDWKLISLKTGRSIYSLQKRFATLDSESGPWKEDEVVRLKRAIKSHMEVVAQQSPSGPALTREQLCNNLPWKNIADKVKGRSWTQCRLKWFSLLKNKLSSDGKAFKRGNQGSQAKIDLINALYSKFSDAEDDGASIEWDEITKVLRNKTPVCIQKMFHRLKSSKVPNWKHLTNKEIILFMYNKLIPHLEQMMGLEESSEQETGKRYHLSDIFSNNEEETESSSHSSKQDTDAQLRRRLFKE